MTARHLAYAATLLAFAALLYVGQHYHWIEEAWTAERDGFVAQAEKILSGHLPADGFRPPLYPILTASLTWAFGSAFAAARFLSNLAAAGVILCAFELGRRLHSDAAGLGALALTAANANVWTHGQHTTTDMPFACLAAWTLLAGLSYLQRPSFACAAAAGVAYGVSAFTRSNAVLLLPALGLAYYWAGPATTGARKSWRHCAVGAGCAIAILVPLWVIRIHSFGTPFFDENYKNLWWKLHGNLDWSALDRAPQTSMASLLLREPGPIARAGAIELVTFVRRVPELIGGWGALGLLGWALVDSLRARRTANLYLIISLGFFTVGVATVFFAWPRFMLLWVPLSAALIFDGLLRIAGKLNWPHANLATSAAAVVLVSWVFARTLLRKVPEFIARHPYDEVTALRSIESDVPVTQRLAGTAPFLGRYLARDYVAVPDAFGPETQNAQAYLDHLEDFLRSRRVAYLVVSRPELGQRPKCLLAPDAGEMPPWLQLVRHERNAALWKIVAR
jgi:4-amino-4-deoxy-L-arabinose transferase-like glycosyltransferase